MTHFRALRANLLNYTQYLTISPCFRAPLLSFLHFKFTVVANFAVNAKCVFEHFDQFWASKWSTPMDRLPWIPVWFNIEYCEAGCGVVKHPIQIIKIRPSLYTSSHVCTRPAGGKQNVNQTDNYCMNEKLRVRSSDHETCS